MELEELPALLPAAVQDRPSLRAILGQPPLDPFCPRVDKLAKELDLTGKTFFKDLPFTELKRLAIDIETFTAPGFEFSNPGREEDRIISVAMAGSDGFTEVLDGNALSEPALLQRLTELIQRYDPDVLEGHNLFRFDLEYIRVRATRHSVRLAWGRDGSEPRVHTSRFTVAERAIDYPRWNVYGRNVVDTYFLVQLYDISLRSLESHGLKQVARHFGIAADERAMLERLEGLLDEAVENDHLAGALQSRPGCHKPGLQRNHRRRHDDRRPDRALPVPGRQCSGAVRLQHGGESDRLAAAALRRPRSGRESGQTDRQR